VARVAAQLVKPPAQPTMVRTHHLAPPRPPVFRGLQPLRVIMRLVERERFAEPSPVGSGSRIRGCDLGWASVLGRTRGARLGIEGDEAFWRMAAGNSRESIKRPRRSLTGFGYGQNVIPKGGVKSDDSAAILRDSRDIFGILRCAAVNASWALDACDFRCHAPDHKGPVGFRRLAWVSRMTVPLSRTGASP
jgi:hypothetical protein